MATAPQPLTQVVVANREHARQLAKAFKSAGRFTYTATAVLTGYPKLRPFDTVVVKGVPEEELRGVWVVLTVQHVFNANGVAAYQCEVTLGTNPAILKMKVTTTTDVLDENSGLEDSLDEEVESLESVDSEDILEIVDGFLDPDDAFTEDTYPVPELFSQSAEPRTPLLGEVWWNPNASSMFIGSDRAWVQVGLEPDITEGTLVGSYPVVLDPSDESVWVSGPGDVLFPAVLSDQPPTPTSRPAAGAYLCVSGSLGASWGSEGSSWYRFDGTTWSSSEPNNPTLAEAGLLAMQLVSAAGWVLSPRGLEATPDALNEDPWTYDIPDFTAALGEDDYWVAGE